MKELSNPEWKKYCYACMHRLKEGEDICPNCGWDDRATVAIDRNLPPCMLRDRYVVGKKLGYGDFGFTYIGFDLHLERVVAIKEYFPLILVHRASDGMTVKAHVDDPSSELFERGKSRVLREARTVAGIGRLPHVAQIYAVFPANGTVYVVMEYITGDTLDIHTMLSKAALWIHCAACCSSP